MKLQLECSRCRTGQRDSIVRINLAHNSSIVLPKFVDLTKMLVESISFDSFTNRQRGMKKQRSSLPYIRYKTIMIDNIVRVARQSMFNCGSTYSSLFSS